MCSSFFDCLCAGAALVSLYVLYLAFATSAPLLTLIWPLAIVAGAKMLASIFDHLHRRETRILELVESGQTHAEAKLAWKSSLIERSRVSKNGAPSYVSGCSESSAETPDKDTWDAELYQVGRAIGGHWARREAAADQLKRINGLGNGEEWLRENGISAHEVITMIDPGKNGIAGSDDAPSISFLAGFIDGVQASESA